MKKMKWFGIGSTSALSVGVVTTAAIIGATSSGVVSFNPGTLSSIEEVVANQDQPETYTIAGIEVPGITTKKSKPKSNDSTSPSDDGVISVDDDVTTDDVTSAVTSTSVASPVEDETVVTPVSVVSEVSPVTPITPVSEVTPVSPISEVSPVSPVSND